MAELPGESISTGTTGRAESGSGDATVEHLARLDRTRRAVVAARSVLASAEAERAAALDTARRAGLSQVEIDAAAGAPAGTATELPVPASVYDTIGTTYRATRRADPRIRDRIWAAVGDAATVVNVGAGTGSYEPPSTLIAIEPSLVMAAQRPAGAAPVALCGAERIPLPDQSVDAALAVLSAHHFADAEAGIGEMLRVARRVVILTFDQPVVERFWLVRDYLPQIASFDRHRAVGVERVRRLVPECRVVAVPVPHDCQDGFLGAYWRRPQAYLDPAVQAGISTFTQLAGHLGDGLRRLARDVETGAWQETYRDLLALEELDVGYRLVVADTIKPGSRISAAAPGR